MQRLLKNVIQCQNTLKFVLKYIFIYIFAIIYSISLCLIHKRVYINQYFLLSNIDLNLKKKRKEKKRKEMK